MALALYAVVKTYQTVHFEAEFKALSNGVNQPEEFNSIPLSTHGQRRRQGWRQIGPRLFND